MEEKKEEDPMFMFDRGSSERVSLDNFSFIENGEEPAEDNRPWN